MAPAWPFGELQPRSFKVIAADPPWHFSGGVKSRPQHYARMTDAEICALPVRDLADPASCWLFLWTTGPKLPDAFKVLKAWRFRYSAMGFVWLKTHRRFGRAGASPLFLPRDAFHVGTGYTTRSNAEVCLLAKVGRPARNARDVAELIVSPLREHSRKPDEFYDRVARFADGPYLELFARQERPGWHAWGNETGKFGAAA